MATYKGILLAKSPYYITEAGGVGFTSSLEIRIWSGAMASEPVEANYSMTKPAVSSTATKVTFEISKIVESFFNHLPNPNDLSASDRTETLWVNVKSGGGSANRDDTWLAVDGYSYFLDGINYDTTDSVLISEDILYHYDGFPITLPVHCDGVSKANKLVFKKNGSTILTDDFSAFNSSTNSYDKIQYTSNIGTTAQYDSVEIQDNSSTVLKTLTIESGTCSKYVPHLVSFINKFGAMQDLMFSLVSKETISATKNTFKRQTLDISTGTPTYDVGKHVFKDYNSNVRESITLNTNYIDESLNDTLGQLISSEAVWITVDGITSPVNVTTQTLAYKKSINDGLINYAVQFEYAFNKRNNIY